LPKGLYIHYKDPNKRYRVLGVAVDSETLEELVLYQALYANEIIWARPLKMFFEEVEVGGRKVPRFKYLGN